MIRPERATAVFLLAIAAASGAGADILSDEAWREDLSALAQQIESTHLAPFHTVSETDFHEAVARLDRAIPDMADGEIALEFRRIAALIGDGHTWLSYGDLPLVHKYPVAVYWFDDGLFITHATRSHEHLVGAKIIRIGSGTAEEILEAAEPYTSRDNEWMVRHHVVAFPNTPEFLHMKGFVSDMERAEFVVEDRDGARSTVVLAPISTETYVEMASARPDSNNLPLYRRDMSVSYWMVYLKKPKTVYVKFNAVVNMKGGPHLARFSKEVIELVDKKRAKNLIIDVRHNGGGNGDMLTPFIRRISEHEGVNREGHLFVLTSRQTFSAALMFIMRMERETKALFAGEPSGGKPNSWGESNRFELTHSKMIGSVSNRFHQEGAPDDTREFLPMDIRVPNLGADYFANEDPVLDAVLEYIAKH